jgi:hypothetical protein
MSLTTDERAWLHRIEEKIDGVKGDVAYICAHGCVQAPRHDDHEKRMRKLEASENQRIGSMAVVATAITVAGMWIKGMIWK